jgi:hypothetical protein
LAIVSLIVGHGGAVIRTFLLLTLTSAAAHAGEPVQLEIHQEFEKAMATVHVDGPTRAFLGGAGVPIKRGALRLVIDIDGSAQPSDYKRDDGRKVEKWTYATVSGTLSLERGAETLSEGHFYQAYSGFEMMLRGNAYATRSQAPYQKAFDLSGFVPSLARAMAPIVDSAAMVRGLDAIARSSASDELRKSALCRLTRESDPSTADRMVELLKLRKKSVDGPEASKETDTRLLGAIVVLRARKGILSTEERAELASRYAGCLGNLGGSCGTDHDKGWCGAEPDDDAAVLQAIGEPVIATLSKMAKSGQRLEQERAIARLAAMRATSAVPLLVELLKDYEYSTRIAAADALGVIADPAAREPLAAAARDDREDMVRSAATRAIERMNGGYGGVGMLLDLELQVKKLDDGGPAQRAGVQVGDRLLSIDGQAVGTKYDPVVAQLKGQPDSTVVLVLRRKEAGVAVEKTFSITRAFIKLPPLR